MHVAMHITHNKIPSCPKGEEGSRIVRCAGKGFEFFRRDFSFESGLLQDLGHLFIFLVFFLGPLPFFLLGLLYSPFQSFFFFVRLCSVLRSFVPILLTLLFVLGRHFHFTCGHLPSADDSVQSNLEISKLLVNSVQHPG